MKQHLVIGHEGEVGSALFRLLRKNQLPCYGVDKGDAIPNVVADFIHICIPFSADFTAIVSEYVKRIKGEPILIIHSTVAPGTTKTLEKATDRVAFSPVRGKHPHLEEGLLKYSKFFATANKDIIGEITKFFSSIGIKSQAFEDPTSLEAAKLVNTTWYFTQIVFAQEVVKLSIEHDFDTSLISKFVSSTGGRSLLPFAQKIGGHCLVPNAKVMSDYIGSDLAKCLVRLDKDFGNLFGDKKFPLET
ncbi:MAG: hypothetical protein ACFFB3_09855 [Candidatus Hodarchaeota archaeon]